MNIYETLHRFNLWRARRRLRRHLRWLQKNRVTVIPYDRRKPPEDSRNWSERYMRTLRNDR
jgi:hypothetical protein